MCEVLKLCFAEEVSSGSQLWVQLRGRTTWGATDEASPWRHVNLDTAESCQEALQKKTLVKSVSAFFILVVVGVFWFWIFFIKNKRKSHHINEKQRQS